jgi:L-cysteine desulfidase
MVDKEIREQIIAMVHREVVPAIGCTEPMCKTDDMVLNIMTSKDAK